MRTKGTVSQDVLHRLWSELAVLRQKVEQAERAQSSKTCPVDVVYCSRESPASISLRSPSISEIDSLTPGQLLSLA